jgi:putative PEP-CTERM system TPR-repeat lipoprotein
LLAFNFQERHLKTFDLPDRQLCSARALVFVCTAILFVAASAPAQAAISPATSSGTNAEAPANNAAVRQYVADAQKALKEGNIRLTIILLKNALNAAPKDAMLRAQLGFVLLQSGDPVQAERELRQARSDGAPPNATTPALLQAMLLRHEEAKLLEEFPDPGPTAQGIDSANVLKGRALALQATGKPADANAAMERSLALHRDVSGLLTKAQIAELQHNLDLAKQLSDEALKSDPKNVTVLMFKLGVLMLANDNTGSLALGNQLIQTNPNNMAARLARIEIFFKLKQDSQAKADVDMILAKAPNAPIGLYYKALLKARANDVKGAWRIAQSLPPEFTQAQPSTAIMVAQMAISSGNVDTGAAILSATLAKSPNNAELRLRLAAVRMRQNNPQDAMSILEPIKDSSDPRVLALLSQVYLKLNRSSDALDVLNKLNAAHPDPGIRRELALVEMQAGQSDQALKDLIELGAKQPTDPTVAAPLIAALVQAKRFSEALAAADRLATDPKQRTQALFFRGEVLLQQGDVNGALAAFQKVLQLDPKNVATLYLRAQLFAKQRRLPEATHDLQAILTIDPKNVSALVQLADVSAQQNNDKDARSLLAKAMSLAPSNPTPRLALIRYLINRHDLKGALSVASDTVRLLPKNADALTLMGQLQLGLAQKKEAVASFRQVVALQPRSAKPRVLLANALFANGDRTGAADALNAAAALEPNSGDVCAAQINLMLAQGDADGAVAKAKAFQTANPSAAADVLLADTLVKAKRLDQAASVLTQSYSAHPNGTALSRLAQLKIAAGDTKQAATLLANWLTSNPRDLEVRIQYATMLMMTRDTAQSAAQFELILKQDSKNVAALNNLAWLLQRSDPKRALSLGLLADKQSPNSPDVLDTIGMIKLGQKDAKGALDFLNRAHALRPKDGEISYHVVLALDANGKRESAKGLLTALINSGVKFADLANASQLLASWH